MKSTSQSEKSSAPLKPSPQMLDRWGNDRDGPVALVFRQSMLPVEGQGSVVFPPTYADIGYNIDTLSDGTKVATLDSVGAQANRIEPMFKTFPDSDAGNPLAQLVPQIFIEYGNGQSVSILDVGHRLGDALVRGTGSSLDKATHSEKSLADLATAAFQKYQRNGDVSGIARLAPTSLVFGVWDSRETQAKLPRIVQSVIRAWDVDPLTRSAQYNPPVNYTSLEVFTETDQEKQEGKADSPLAKRGYVHIPSTEQHGGVIVRDEIRRDVTVNLVALRRLAGSSDEESAAIREYILGLALVAATVPFDGFLRQGCLITPDPDAPGAWEMVERDGLRTPLALRHEDAIGFAKQAADKFGIASPKRFQFDKKLAKNDATKKPSKKGRSEG